MWADRETETDGATGEQRQADRQPEDGQEAEHAGRKQTDRADRQRYRQQIERRT